MNALAATTHALDRAIALVPGGTDIYVGRTSPDYANMVGPFGGVIGATLLNAIMNHPARLGDPVALTVHFAAPVADGAFTVTTRAVRTNRSTQHWLIELTQTEQVVAFATAVTALRRDTWSGTDVPFPKVPPADAIAPSAPNARARWTHCYEMRFIDGEADATSKEHPSQTRLWLRDHPPRALDFQSLASICDAFFPRIFVRRDRRVPARTVALTTYFHADAAQLRAQGSAPVLGVARGVHFGKGFFDQSAEVWSEDGTLLASSHQIVYFKE
jgi:acyl-CoA thioesterase